MEIVRNDGGLSDDEDDLELLRIAALQTIKKSMGGVAGVNQAAHVQTAGYGSPSQCKRGRGFHAGVGRGGRNGNFNNRTRNTNLISIPTVQPEENIAVEQPKKGIGLAPKLVLPQDRYCNKLQSDESEKVSSKFSRYDNSDDSESDEESLASADTDTEEGKGLKRADSLEELMQELENEISGEKTKNVKVRVKKRSRVRRLTEVNEPTPAIIENTVNAVKQSTPEKVTVKQSIPEKVADKPDVHIKRRSPPIPNGNRNNFRHRPNFIPQNLPTYPAYPPQALPMVYNEPPAPLFNNIPYQQPPPYHPPPTFRPLSPLTLNTAALSTIAMAPLSPRSAAFVRHNREIIERRKKSPRRSYSRSPSPPRFRTRAPSPRRYPPSLSPPHKKNGRIPRHSPPPKRRPATPPKPKASTPPPPPLPVNKSVRERLGTRKEEPKRKRTPSPEAVVPTKQVKPDDPVLEARRKKFEETPIKEGIIKLKTKEPETDDDTLELGHLDDIFDDEESDEENEGRFKSSSASTATKRTVAVPFSQLVNGGPNKDVKEKPLDELICRAPHRSERRREMERRKRAPSPRGGRRRETPRVTSPIENKRIEIKIRNPAKYEDDTKKERGTARKVAIAKTGAGEETATTTGVVGDVMSDADRKTEGDLRAQLSRKRAERQHKQPVAAADCQTRLIQNALQGAVFKKPRKSKEADKETAPKDKLPIHLRLGGTKDSESKRKKSKSRSTEQV